jgi:hypothetical protein
MNDQTTKGTKNTKTTFRTTLSQNLASGDDYSVTRRQSTAKRKGAKMQGRKEEKG